MYFKNDKTKECQMIFILNFTKRSHSLTSTTYTKLADM